MHQLAEGQRELFCRAGLLRENLGLQPASPAHSEPVLPGGLQQLDHLHRGAQLRDGGQGVRDVLAVLVAVAIELGEAQGRSLGHSVGVGAEMGCTVRCCPSSATPRPLLQLRLEENRSAAWEACPHLLVAIT